MTAAPKPQPTTTSAPPEPVPTPTVERSRDTAKEFVSGYFAAYQEALRAGRPEPLRGMGTAECAKCANVIDGFAQLVAERATYPDAKVTAVPFESYQGRDLDIMLWTVDYRLEMGDKVVDHRTVKTPNSSSRLYFHLELHHDGARWWINGMATDRDLAGE